MILYDTHRNGSWHPSVRCWSCKNSHSTRRTTQARWDSTTRQTISQCNCKCVNEEIIIGRPRKISPKVVRALIWKARTGVYTASELRRMFQVNVSVRRIKQILQADDRLTWKRMKRAPPLSKRHREEKVKFAKNILRNTTSWWRNVVFSDEKGSGLTVLMD